MSLIKWRKREITTVICSLILVVLNTIIFHFIWTRYYSPHYYSKFFSIGRYAAQAMCFGLYILFGRLYGAFWLKVNRISEIIYANIVTNIMTAGVMYLTAWVFIRHLPNILPMLLLVFSWTVAACIWIKPAIMLMNHYCSVERLAIIHHGHISYQNIMMTLSRVAWRFKVVGEVEATTNIASIMEQLRVLRAEAVLLCDIPSELKNEVLKQCILENIVTYAQPNASDYLMNSAKSTQVANMPFLCCQRASNSNLYTFIKRALDIALGCIGIIISSPIMLAIVIAVKAYDKGPVLVKEQRVTLNRKLFDIYKFRSVKTGVDENDYSYQSLYTDERLTPVGKVIRRFRLNELPKLFNVLKGDIAIVGPRADRPEEMEKNIKEMPEYALKYQTKPGLTGYVQIYGRYTTSINDSLQMDLMYMGHESLAWDLKMILATIKVIFLPEGMNLVLDGRVFMEEEGNYHGEVEA